MLYKTIVLSLVALTSGAPRVGKQLLKKFSNVGIFGGHDANIEDFPYQVSLLQHGEHICGGSIIDSTHVLTAAHCTDGSLASELQIRAGSSIFEEGGTVVSVKAIHQNPSFDWMSIDNDVSVLKLSSALSFGTGINSVSLASSELEAGNAVNVTGWGTTEKYDYSKQLQVVSVEMISRENCRSAYGDDEITDRMICAGVNGGGKDSCQGDSGGPLVSNGTQYGIVSWGNDCAEAAYPGVYSNVAALLDYIDSVID